MSNESRRYAWQLIVVIVNEGQGSRAIRIGRRVGVKGATIVLGRGTLKRPLLRLLELDHVRKEIVLMVTENSLIVNNAMSSFEHELKLTKPNHGIAFSIDVSHFLGTGDYNYKHEHESEELAVKNQAIFVIVDKGNAELAMRVAEKEGATGGTIINARGSGIHETGRVFNMAIEPEKEILLIVTDAIITETIVDAIKKELRIEEPGRGIIFVQDVKEAVGLRKAK